MNLVKSIGMIPAFCVMLCAGISNAAPVTIENGGFEQAGFFTSPFMTFAAGSGGIGGWLIDGAGVDHIANYWDASEGTYSLDLNADAAGSVSQEIENLTIGAEYRVMFDMAANLNGGPAVKSLIASIGDYSGTFTYDGTGNTVSDMGWMSMWFLFTATETTETLTFTGVGNSAYGAALDNVSIIQTPVPGTLLLFGTALGALGIARSRRKRVKSAD